MALTNSNNANNYIRWDSCGAHGIIQRIRIFHGSNLLQDIDSYGLLAKVLFDLQVPTDAAYGKYNILAGTRNDLIVNLPDITAGAAYSQADMIALDNAFLSCKQINSGDAISNNLGANADSTAITYCLNLISLLGSLSSTNYIPLFAATSAPIRMEIQLVDSAAKAMASLSPIVGIKVSNCEYVANFIELSDSAMGLIQGSLQGQPLQFVVPDYRNYQFTYTLANGTATQVQMPIAAKFSSLKSIFVTARDKGTGTATFFPFSSVTCGITDYTFRVGSQIMPTKAPSTMPEMFSEVLKSVGSMSDLSHQPSIELASYTLAQSVAHTSAAASNSGSFYVGLDLENYANAAKDSIFAGYNSNTDDIYAIMNFTAPAALANVRFDAFAMSDEVVVFENNTAFVRY